MSRQLLLLLVQAAAFWDIWRWYVHRLMTGADAVFGLVALGAALLIAAAQARADTRPAGPSGLWLAAALTLGAAVASRAAPPIFAAALAFAALLATAAGSVARLRPGTIGLALLALPVVPQFDFFLGLPLRTVTAATAATVLQMAGFTLSRDGTCLAYQDRLVAVDAPCSGIRMLWTAWLVASLLSALRGAGWWRTAAIWGIALILVLAANAARSVILFFPEAGIVPAPSWFHDAAGIVSFFGVATTLAWINSRPGRSTRWPAPSPSC